MYELVWGSGCKGKGEAVMRMKKLRNRKTGGNDEFTGNMKKNWGKLIID